MNAMSYAGDKTPKETWRELAAGRRAILVDVRTAAEWTYVGMPDLAEAGALLLRAEWQSYPSMQVDPDFVGSLDRAIRAAGGDRDSPLFFICRSGARSAAAAAAMTGAGYARCYNVAGGFEGRRDPDGHRGTLDGWKADGLPWMQG